MGHKGSQKAMTDETIETLNGTAAVEAEAPAKPKADLGRQAIKAADQAREQSAKGLLKAADKLREEVRSGDADEEAVRRADQLADGLEKTALYLKETSVPEMEEQFEERVKAQPYQALLIALVIGLIIGFLIPKPKFR
jgi:ElaB/YqjD/DUF883 family membrane-anchored ribosome-binding protein